MLRVLTNANDSEVQRQTLELSLQLVTSRTVKDYVSILKKHLRATHAAVTFREMIVETLHQCVKSFPQTASSIVSCVSFSFDSRTRSPGLGELSILAEISMVSLDLREILQRWGSRLKADVDTVQLTFVPARRTRLVRQAFTGAHRSAFLA